MNERAYTRRAIIAAGAVWLAVAMVEASNGVATILGLFFLALLGFCTAVAWFSYSVACFRSLKPWRRAAVWLAVPALGLVGVVGFPTGWPMAIRVWLCEQSLNEYAITANPDEQPRYQEVRVDRVGLFTVQHVDKSEGSVLLTTSSTFVSLGGVAYAPDGVPASSPMTVNFTHLYGPWYRFEIPG
jgi:hypothetical protein